ncbi:hypothetical protein RSOLAG22IIIB_00683 [Rhizoctonia solani]|uniref:RlpA-like protein double-psi beta-barrel domain-containing protein n=1 Tax=Rhizoctonia solani TaxID=456999 RepID=A0A0K6FVW8_9AGAM|nr:hypothetical protein RSOLAG22IIIB_00683 [Rhizoctonia solani]
MMFNKMVAVTAVVGASSLFSGVDPLPTNVTESAIKARAINPGGNHVGQSQSALTLAVGGTLSFLHGGMVNELLSSPTSRMTTIRAKPAETPITALYNCGRTANITYSGKTIRVGIVDRCEGCALWGVGLSPSAFQVSNGYSAAFRFSHPSNDNTS